MERRDALRSLAGFGIGSLASSLGGTAVAQNVGTVRWEFPTDDYQQVPPTVVDDTVYFGSNDGKFYAADAQSGEQLWEWPADGTGETFRRAPAVADGTVYVDNRPLRALDAETGELQWEASVGGGRSPTVADGFVFVANEGGVAAVDASNGESLWSFETEVFTSSSPTLVDGTVYFGNWENRAYALDAVTGEERWRFEANDDMLTAATVVDGTVYMGSRDTHLYALDAATGEKQWDFMTQGPVTESTPTVAHGNVYFASNGGKTYALDAETGDRKWEAEIRGYWSAPTVVDDTLYIGSTDNHVYALGAHTGEIRWQLGTGDTIYNKPVVVDGVLYIGSRDNTLYAIETGEDGSSQDSRVLHETNNHHHEVATRVRVPPQYQLAIADINGPVTIGEDLEVTVAVTNVGGQQGGAEVTVEAGSFGSETRTVPVDGLDKSTATFVVSTAGGEPGESTVTARLGDDSVTDTVTLEKAPEPEPDEQEQPDSAPNESDGDSDSDNTLLWALGGGSAIAVALWYHRRRKQAVSEDAGHRQGGRQHRNGEQIQAGTRQADATAPGQRAPPREGDRNPPPEGDRHQSAADERHQPADGDRNQPSNQRGDTASGREDDSRQDRRDRSERRDDRS